MSSIARLTIGVPRGKTLSEEETPFLLVGRNDVPLLWSCGFVESELRHEARGGDEDDDEAWQAFFFETTVGELRGRLEALAPHLKASGSEYVRELWEGCATVTQALAGLPDDAVAVLDANEVAALAADGAVEANLLKQTKTFAELREAWNPELACSMTREVRQDVLTGTLPSDRTRARRATGAESERAGFFTLMFGAAYGKLAAPVQAWLDAAPHGAPLRPLDEEAKILVDALVKGGVIALPKASRASALTYLEIAARFRTPEALQEILDVLFGQGVVKVGKVKPVRFRALDRFVGMKQEDEVPVFDRAVLATVVATLGD